MPMYDNRYARSLDKTQGEYLPLQSGFPIQEVQVNLRVHSPGPKIPYHRQIFEANRLKFHESLLQEETYVDVSQSKEPEAYVRRYLGDELPTDLNLNKIEYLSLEEFVNSLSSYRIVNSVYVLEDKRAPVGKTPTEENYVELIIKFDPKNTEHLRNHPSLFNAMNDGITSFLVNKGIYGASGIRVSFQYAQVYYHGGEHIDE